MRHTLSPSARPAPRRSGTGVLLAVAIVAAAPLAFALYSANAFGQTPSLATSATAPAATPPAAAASADPEIAKMAAMPAPAQAQWLARSIKSGEFAKLSDDQIIARMQALNPDALVRFLKSEAAAMPEYQYELTRHERLNGQWQSTPDRMLVKIREKPLQIYAKWLPDGAHSGQEIIYDETKNKSEMYGHLGGILGFTSIWSSIDGTLARGQSNHTVRDLGFAFIAEQIAHDGRSFRSAGLPEKAARMQVTEVGGVRVLALEWDAPSGPPQHYANKSRVLIDLKTGRPRGIEAWDAAGQKVEEMRFEKVRKEDWTDATFDPKSPDYKF